MSTELGQREFRRVLGNYPTGVALVTTRVDDVDEGMIVGTFSSVSLSPPLVSFMPAKSSSTWPKIEASGVFAVNVLSSEQSNVCRDFGAKTPERFDRYGWTSGALGLPLLLGAVAWLECRIVDVLDAGDHWIVLGEVVDLEAPLNGHPLLFFKGAHGGFRPEAILAHDVELAGILHMASKAGPRLESLAREARGVAVVLAAIGHEVVVVSSVGSLDIGVDSVWAGLRQPFIPPVGTQFVSRMSEADFDAWIERLERFTGRDHREAVQRLASNVKARGYSITRRPELYMEFSRLVFSRNRSGGTGELDLKISELCAQMLLENERLSDDAPSADVWSIHVPVQGTDPWVSVGVYPARPLTHEEVSNLATSVVGTAAALSLPESG